MTRVDQQDKHEHPDGRELAQAEPYKVFGIFTARKSILLASAGFALFAVTAGLTSVILHMRPSLLATFNVASWSSKRICKTIATDPNPPLNVRSSPVSAPDNVVGKLRNGTQLTVVDENEGWVRISRPLEGWVYKELTVTSCVSAATARVVTPPPTDSGSNILAEATEYYHSGNLEGAIALAQTVPANNPSYQLAQGTIVQWQQDWKVAETEFYASQKALREGRWQDVLTKIKTFPDNRFWRGKMAPLVRASIQKQVETRR